MKKILTASILLATGLLFASGNYLQNVSAETQEKAKLEQLAKDYLHFKNNFHKLPDDKMEKRDHDNPVIEDTIKTKNKELKLMVKENSNLHAALAENIEHALKDQQKGERRSFGGKAKDVQILSYDITDNSAHIKLTYVAEATLGQWQGDHYVKASPSNRLQVELDFEKNATGAWVITNEAWEFALGSQP